MGLVDASWSRPAEWAGQNWKCVHFGMRGDALGGRGSFSGPMVDPIRMPALRFKPDFVSLQPINPQNRHRTSILCARSIFPDMGAPVFTTSLPRSSAPCSFNNCCLDLLTEVGTQCQ